MELRDDGLQEKPEGLTERRRAGQETGGGSEQGAHSTLVRATVHSERATAHIDEQC